MSARLTYRPFRRAYYEALQRALTAAWQGMTRALNYAAQALQGFAVAFTTALTPREPWYVAATR